ncbi:MAG: globin [Novosphingobium sp.]
MFVSHENNHAPGRIFEASIEAVALTSIDVVPMFFDWFFQAQPEQRDNFNRPGATQGAMVNEMIAFLADLACGDASVDHRIHDCISRHHSYGAIASAQFAEACEVLHETMKSAAGRNWVPEYSRVWAMLIDRLRTRAEANDDSACHEPS